MNIRADIHPRLWGMNMPVYLFTFHAYRSWMPDRPQGYVRPGQGVLPQDPKMSQHYARRAKHDEVRFDATQRWRLVDEAGEVCARQGWEIYEATATRSHTHLLVGWRTDAKWKDVSNRLKRRLGYALSMLANRPGPWFSRGSSRKRVRDREHFEHLLQTYLPKHGPICWSRRKEPR
jgi:REP element-mobilizing transposase RayT